MERARLLAVAVLVPFLLPQPGGAAQGAACARPTPSHPAFALLATPRLPGAARGRLEGRRRATWAMCAGQPASVSGPEVKGEGNRYEMGDFEDEDIWVQSMVPFGNELLRVEKRKFKGGMLRFKGEGQRAWRAFGQEARREYPLLRALMQQWPRTWLRGERRLAQILKESPPPPYLDNDNPPPSALDKSLVFEIPSRYHISGMAGRGAFANVAWGKDTRSGKRVAIKKLGDAIPDDIAGPRLTRELSMLRKVRGHVNLVSAVDLITRCHPVSDPITRERRDICDVYIVTDLMLADMGNMLDSGYCLSPEQVRCLLFQLFRAVRHMHACGVIHRDIKPANLLIDPLWRLKVCDLGIARASIEFDASKAHLEHDRRFTDYVVTRPYRAPELLMGCRNYTAAVDMWSAGCVMGEILAGEYLIERAPLSRFSQKKGWQRLPLFPGKDHKDTVQKIISVLGHPPNEALCTLAQWEPRAANFVWDQPYSSCDLNSKEEVHGIHNQQGDYCNIEAGAERVDWHAIYPKVSQDALDLLDALLEYDPAKRPTAAEALEHPYFASFKVPGADEDRVHHESEIDLAMRRAAKRSLPKWDLFWQEAESKRRRNTRRVWKAKPPLRNGPGPGGGGGQPGQLGQLGAGDAPAVPT